MVSRSVCQPNFDTLVHTTPALFGLERFRRERGSATFALVKIGYRHHALLIPDASAF
jgi:hypothetical protein